MDIYHAEGGYDIGGFQQSFTPPNSAISFVEFGFYDKVSGNGIGTDIYVNLREGSFNGQILARTKIVTVPDGARDVTRFNFGRNIHVSPETLYFLEPVRVSGARLYSFNAYYSRGDRYYNGIKRANTSLIFREGFEEAEITSLAVTNNVVNIAWKGVGRLQTASSILGPWIEFPDKTNGTEQINLEDYGISTNGVHVFRISD